MCKKTLVYSKITTAITAFLTAITCLTQPLLTQATQPQSKKIDIFQSSLYIELQDKNVQGFARLETAQQHINKLFENLKEHIKQEKNKGKKTILREKDDLVASLAYLQFEAIYAVQLTQVKHSLFSRIKSKKSLQKIKVSDWADFWQVYQAALQASLNKENPAALELSVNLLNDTLKNILQNPDSAPKIADLCRSIYNIVRLLDWGYIKTPDNNKAWCDAIHTLDAWLDSVKKWEQTDAKLDLQLIREVKTDTGAIAAEITTLEQVLLEAQLLVKENNTLAVNTTKIQELQSFLKVHIDQDGLSAAQNTFQQAENPQSPKADNRNKVNSVSPPSTKLQSAENNNTQQKIKNSSGDNGNNANAGKEPVEAKIKINKGENKSNPEDPKNSGDSDNTIVEKDAIEPQAINNNHNTSPSIKLKDISGGNKQEEYESKIDPNEVGQKAKELKKSVYETIHERCKGASLYKLLHQKDANSQYILQGKKRLREAVKHMDTLLAEQDNNNNEVSDDLLNSLAWLYHEAEASIYLGSEQVIGNRNDLDDESTGKSSIFRSVLQYLKQDNNNKPNKQDLQFVWKFYKNQLLRWIRNYGKRENSHYYVILAIANATSSDNKDKATNRAEVTWEYSQIKEDIVPGFYSAYFVLQYKYIRPKRAEKAQVEESEHNFLKLATALQKFNNANVGNLTLNTVLNIDNQEKPFGVWLSDMNILEQSRYSAKQTVNQFKLQDLLQPKSEYDLRGVLTVYDLQNLIKGLNEFLKNPLPTSVEQLLLWPKHSDFNGLKNTLQDSIQKLNQHLGVSDPLMVNPVENAESKNEHPDNKQKYDPNALLKELCTEPTQESNELVQPVGVPKATYSKNFATDVDSLRAAGLAYFNGILPYVNGELYDEIPDLYRTLLALPYKNYIKDAPNTFASQSGRAARDYLYGCVRANYFWYALYKKIGVVYRYLSYIHATKTILHNIITYCDEINSDVEPNLVIKLNDQEIYFEDWLSLVREIHKKINNFVEKSPNSLLKKEQFIEQLGLSGVEKTLWQNPYLGLLEKITEQREEQNENNVVQIAEKEITADAFKPEKDAIEKLKPASPVSVDNKNVSLKQLGDFAKYIHFIKALRNSRYSPIKTGNNAQNLACSVTCGKALQAFVQILAQGPEIMLKNIDKAWEKDWHKMVITNQTEQENFNNNFNTLKLVEDSGRLEFNFVNHYSQALHSIVANTALLLQNNNASQNGNNSLPEKPLEAIQKSLSYIGNLSGYVPEEGLLLGDTQNVLQLCDDLQTITEDNLSYKRNVLFAVQLACAVALQKLLGTYKQQDLVCNFTHGWQTQNSLQDIRATITTLQSYPRIANWQPNFLQEVKNMDTLHKSCSTTLKNIIAPNPSVDDSGEEEVLNLNNNPKSILETINNITDKKKQKEFCLTYTLLQDLVVTYTYPNPGNKLTAIKTFYKTLKKFAGCLFPASKKDTIGKEISKQLKIYISTYQALFNAQVEQIEILEQTKKTILDNITLYLTEQLPVQNPSQRQGQENNNNNNRNDDKKEQIKVDTDPKKSAQNNNTDNVINSNNNNNGIGNIIPAITGNNTGQNGDQNINNTNNKQYLSKTKAMVLTVGVAIIGGLLWYAFGSGSSKAVNNSSEESKVEKVENKLTQQASSATQ